VDWIKLADQLTTIQRNFLPLSLDRGNLSDECDVMFLVTGML